MKVPCCAVLAVLTLAYGKNIPIGDDVDVFSEMPKYLDITKELDEKKLLPANFFPHYALQKVDKNEVQFVFSSQEDTEGTQVDLDDADKVSTKTKFNKNLETIFVVHGWKNTCESTVNQLIKQALLLNHDFNFFAVCWDTSANKNYISAHAAVPQVGQYLGDFIKSMSQANNYDLSKIRVLGHSLGAHIAGWAGKENNGQLSYIIGLDPAGPMYFEWDKENRLDETDAHYVQAIHTDGGSVSGLGVGYKVGDVDFWPNGGHGQPGCGLDLEGMCAHSRSYIFFAESINTNKFFSRKCNTYKNYTKGSCKANIGMYMGGLEFPELTDDLKGDYYLQTASTSPYGLGDNGL